LRAVLDPNVLISALLSPNGAPARVLAAWVDGVFELIISPLLVAELDRALAYPKLRKQIPAEQVTAVVDWLRRSATMNADPADAPPISSPDPDDDYLLSLAADARAALVSGDKHLLSLDTTLPIHTPAAFLAIIEARA
jgi:putative PIN family toxin of toxin-antitoxin system